jgi:L-alanine-DL-glutamate epimerase-like enolase superfamily enzyme
VVGYGFNSNGRYGQGGLIRERVENGHITMPDLPGIGFEGKSDLYAEMKALAA